MYIFQKCFILWDQIEENIHNNYLSLLLLEQNWWNWEHYRINGVLVTDRAKNDALSLRITTLSPIWLFSSPLFTDVYSHLPHLSISFPSVTHHMISIYIVLK